RDSLAFPVDEVAKRHRASVEEDTMDGGIAYAAVPPREPTAYRDGWLPWEPSRLARRRFVCSVGPRPNAVSAVNVPLSKGRSRRRWEDAGAEELLDGNGGERRPVDE